MQPEFHWRAPLLQRQGVPRYLRRERALRGAALVMCALALAAAALLAFGGVL